MVYTVGEMAKMLEVPASTLRYYDKKGLLPFVERSAGGIRMFRDKDYEWLKVIECLKKTGMSLNDIHRYIDLAIEGDSTIDERLALFEKQKEILNAKMEELQATMDMLDYKCWFYKTAKAAGTTKVPQNMSFSEIPKEFQKTYRQLKNEEER